MGISLCLLFFPKEWKAEDGYYNILGRGKQSSGAVLTGYAQCMTENGSLNSHIKVMQKK